MANYTEIEIKDLTSAFLKGDKGDPGAIGQSGLSAYEVALQNGFDGTVEEWLLSLKGEKGEKGEQGNSGMVGFEIRDGHLFAISESSENLKNFKIKDGHMILTI